MPLPDHFDAVADREMDETYSWLYEPSRFQPPYNHPRPVRASQRNTGWFLGILRVSFLLLIIGVLGRLFMAVLFHAIQ